MTSCSIGCTTSKYTTDQWLYSSSSTCSSVSGTHSDFLGFDDYAPVIATKRDSEDIYPFKEVMDGKEVVTITTSNTAHTTSTLSLSTPVSVPHFSAPYQSMQTVSTSRGLSEVQFTPYTPKPPDYAQASSSSVATLLVSTPASVPHFSAPYQGMQSTSSSRSLSEGQFQYTPKPEYSQASSTSATSKSSLLTNFAPYQGIPTVSSSKSLSEEQFQYTSKPEYSQPSSTSLAAETTLLPQFSAPYQGLQTTPSSRSLSEEQIMHYTPKHEYSQASSTSAAADTTLLPQFSSPYQGIQSTSSQSLSEEQLMHYTPKHEYSQALSASAATEPSLLTPEAFLSESLYTVSSQHNIPDDLSTSALLNSGNIYEKTNTDGQTGTWGSSTRQEDLKLTPKTPQGSSKVSDSKDYLNQLGVLKSTRKFTSFQDSENMSESASYGQELEMLCNMEDAEQDLKSMEEEEQKEVERQSRQKLSLYDVGRLPPIGVFWDIENCQVCVLGDVKGCQVCIYETLNLGIVRCVILGA